MEGPLISVIVPVYKAEDYIERCVDSIRSQTYTNLEIILVDDGSPDRCGDLCEELAKQDKRIRVVHKANGGLSSARNAGLDIMTGEYVGFVDSDDCIDPRMYQTLYERLVDQQAQISCCGIARWDGSRVHSCFNPNQEEQFTLERNDAMVELTRNYRITSSVCDKLYRAEIFSQLRMKEGMLYEDFQIQHHCLHRIQRITYTAQPLYLYYQSADSILRGEYTLRHMDCINASQDRIDFYSEYYKAALPYAKAAHTEQCLNVIYKSYGIPEWKEPRARLIEAVQRSEEPEVLSKLSGKDRLKRRLLCISDRLFVAIMDLYYRKKR